MSGHGNFERRLAAIVIAVLMAVTALAQPILAQNPNGPAATAPGSAVPGSPCTLGATPREYDVTSLPIPVSYNHWGDFDPQGRIYIPLELRDAMLDDVGAKLSVAGLGTLADPVADMRAALAANDIAAATSAAARLVDAASAIDPNGPKPADRFDQSDLVTPLVLRAHIGDCITIRLTNIAPEPVSIHTHAVYTAAGAGATVGVQSPDVALPGETHTYTMYIPPWGGMEGAHFLHSHADSRMQTKHGLFGAVVAEPLGSTWNSTADASLPAPFGLEAMIVRPGAPDFREFVKIYHDEIDLHDWTLAAMPSVSDFGEYGPGTKGINLRTEPFMDRFKFHDALRDPDGDGVVDPGELGRGHDKSQSYGSYTYGDPSTWIQRSYLGDPVKFRMINAGPGQHHIHHLHGGGIRWKSTPMAEPSEFAMGLVKEHPNQASASQRLDVQNAGPGESFNLEPEGGTGGVQQSAGDFLYHCHIAEHYLAGMWGIWRAYNTIQPDLAELPDRAAHPQTRTYAAVNSEALLGKVLPDGTVIDLVTDANAVPPTISLSDWVEQFLPAKGVPGEEDASVWNWAKDGNVYLGEPETAFVWPTFKADAPGRLPAGERPEIGFDPESGKPAYPMLRPHLGQRPPFAPNHGGAPWLKHTETKQNPDGLCTKDAVENHTRTYNVVAIQAKNGVKYNKFDKDLKGQVFTLAQDRAALDRTVDPVNPTSIVLRANSKDCIDVTLVSDLKEKLDDDVEEGVHTKTNIHIHLVQFDVQGSDGVVAGYNFETTLRSLNGGYKAKTADPEHMKDPSAQVNTKIAAGGASYDSGTGMTTIFVDSVAPFLDRTGAPKVGSDVGLGLGLTSIESAKLVSVNVAAKSIVVKGDVADHVAGEWIGYEFVRYQWFPDVELGTVYFHDHVNGIDTWRHGLFGSLIIEPTGSRWLPPKRLNDNVSDDPTSHIVDIIPPNGSGRQPYREAVLHFQDRGCVGNTVNGLGDCLNGRVPEMPSLTREPAAFNLRSEPLFRRNLAEPFSNTATWSRDESSTTQNDLFLPHEEPWTPIIEAFPGDDVVIRFLYAGQSMSRGVGTFGVTGHRFQQEQFLNNSRTTDTISVAVSSQHNLQLECGAGGCLRQPGDYLYMMTQPEYIQRGAWGLLRVHEPSAVTTLKPLPDNKTHTVGTIPAGAKVRYYDVSAIETLVTHNPQLGIASTMRRFVLDSELPVDLTQTDPDQPQTVAVSATPPQPLVIRASAGEVVQVNFTNRLPIGAPRIGMHAAMISAGPADQGVKVGKNTATTTAAAGETISYRWYADRELGVLDLTSLVDPVNDAVRGLTGALIIEPAGASFTPSTGPSSTIDLGNGLLAKEQVLLFTSPDKQFESSTMPYVPDTAGLTLVNYATEPLARRMGALLPEQARVQASAVSGTSLSTCHIDNASCLAPTVGPKEVRNPAIMFATSGLAPWTPIVEVAQGQPLVLRVLGASGDQLGVFHVDGHAFAVDPEMDNCRNVLSTCRSNLVSDVTFGAREGRNVWIPAAGPNGIGDYLYRNHRDPYFEAGAWGIVRVTGDPVGALTQTLPQRVMQTLPSPIREALPPVDGP